MPGSGHVAPRATAGSAANHGTGGIVSLLAFAPVVMTEPLSLFRHRSYLGTRCERGGGGGGRRKEGEQNRRWRSQCPSCAVADRWLTEVNRVAT